MTNFLRITGVVGLAGAGLMAFGGPPTDSWAPATAAAVSSNSWKARLDEALKEPDVERRLQRLQEFAGDLSLPEIPAALDASDRLSELRECMTLKQSAFHRWGELSPGAAFTNLAAKPESQWKVNTIREIAAAFARNDPKVAAAAAAVMSPGAARNDVLPLVANLWAQSNATAALVWAEELPAGAAKESALDAVRYVWVHADPVAASTQILKLRPGTTRNNLISNVAFEWSARDPMAALQWVKGIPVGPDRDTAMASIAESWANQDPLAAIAFAMKLEPAELRAKAGALAAARWARQNPQKAADWTWTCGDPETRRRAAKEVITVWAGVNPLDCASWVNSRPPGPASDELTRVFVGAVAMWTPDLATREAMRIESESLRRSALDEAVPRWAEVDPAAAADWLKESSLPERVKARLLAGP